MKRPVIAYDDKLHVMTIDGVRVCYSFFRDFAEPGDAEIIIKNGAQQFRRFDDAHEVAAWAADAFGVSFVVGGSSGGVA